MTNFTNCLTLEQMEYLDLFDNIPYKVVKKLVKMDDDTDFEVEIKEIEIDDYNKCSTSFKFTIKIDISQGWLPLMVDKEYCIIKEYDSSSPMAMFIGENLAYPTDEESESEEEEEKGCMKCGSAPRHNQTDEDGSYLCLSCEEKEEIVFGCTGCKTLIIRDSEAHDHSGTYNDEDWFCQDCFGKNEPDEESDEEEILLIKKE
tara:strand:+ start:205 stop:810 length:606 start_codon:yes stop_codon:yes gene_type:complete